MSATWMTCATLSTVSRPSISQTHTCWIGCVIAKGAHLKRPADVSMRHPSNLLVRAGIAGKSVTDRSRKPQESYDLSFGVGSEC